MVNITGVANFRLSNGKHIYLTEVNGCSTRGYFKTSGNGETLKDTIQQLGSYCVAMGLTYETLSRWNGDNDV